MIWLKNFPLKIAILFFFSGIPVFLINGQNSQAIWRFPSLEAVPKAYELAGRASGNNWRYLAEASLWASSLFAGQGAEERAMTYLGRIYAAAEELAAAPDLPGDPRARGDYVLTFIHRRFLRNYSELQTRVDEIFVSGRYNCVSSAALYMVLALSVGLDVQGVMTRNHAFVTVRIENELVDVETTNRFGFDPGNRREFHDAFGRTTGFAYVPARNYRDRTAISRQELISLIFSNRISAMERGNRFAEAVSLAINRAVFLSESDAAAQDSSHKAEFFAEPRQDMMNRLFNLGAYLIRTGQDDQALAWAEYAENSFLDTRQWEELKVTAVNNKLARLIRARRASEARQTLVEMQSRINSSSYHEFDLMVLEGEAVELVNTIRNSGDIQTALIFLNENWERLPEGRRDEMRITAILNEAERYHRNRDWANGLRWLENIMQQYGGTARIETAIRTMRQNRVNELHNEFALLFNRRDYNGAKASAERSLLEFPGDARLIQNLQRAERALQQ